MYYIEHLLRRLKIPHTLTIFLWILLLIKCYNFDLINNIFKYVIIIHCFLNITDNAVQRATDSK